MPQAPLVLLVLDGWGIRAEREHNAITLARTPVYDELLGRYPMAQLRASGESVGLPAGQMGNSEVGHMNMGAGRVVYQDLTRIDKSISDGDFFTNPALVAALDRAADGRHALHLIGLVSDGGVHSHQRHLHALLEMAARRHVPEVFIHAITDGRDTSPTGGVRYLADLDTAINRLDGDIRVRVATLSGRYYAMDRDKRWERTRLAYDAMVHGVAGDDGAVADWRDRSVVRGRRHRRVHQADRHRRRERTRRSARFATATPSSSSTSAPIARARSPARWRSTSSTASSGSRGRRFTPRR